MAKYTYLPTYLPIFRSKSNCIFCCYYFQEDCNEVSGDLVVNEHDENVMKHKCPTEFENLKIEDVRLLKKFTIYS